MLLVLEDFHPYSEASNPVNIRYLREMMRPQNYEGNYKKAIILSSPSKFVPEELDNVLGEQILVPLKLLLNKQIKLIIELFS